MVNESEINELRAVTRKEMAEIGKEADHSSTLRHYVAARLMDDSSGSQ